MLSWGRRKRAAEGRLFSRAPLRIPSQITLNPSCPPLPSRSVFRSSGVRQVLLLHLFTHLGYKEPGLPHLDTRAAALPRRAHVLPARRKKRSASKAHNLFTTWDVAAQSNWSRRRTSSQLFCAASPRSPASEASASTRNSELVNRSRTLGFLGPGNPW